MSTALFLDKRFPVALEPGTFGERGTRRDVSTSPDRHIGERRPPAHDAID
ncbi:hypothetical protein Q3A80_10585 [Burkholderia sp. SR8]